MGEQDTSLNTTGIIFPLTKNDITTESKSMGTKGTARLIGMSVGVNTHSTKIIAEARLHKVSRGWVQWLTR